MPKVHDKVTSDIKPEWLKIRIRSGEQYAQTAKIVRENALHTICSSGMCPNKAECWNRRTATFMILGDVCTRGCKFCATKTGRTLPVDSDEPERVAGSISLMGLKHAVITSVTRDDLQDGGAEHWAAVVEAVRGKNPNTTIELLIPDMDAVPENIDTVINSNPDIIGHNIETVERLTPLVRSKAEYNVSLRTIKHISDSGIISKSGIMVGLGETPEEVLQALSDLRKAGCSIVTIGQYLQPTPSHWKVSEYITPEKFDWYKEQALKLGFKYVASAPLVRSSYLADRAMECCGGSNNEITVPDKTKAYEKRFI